MGDIGGKTWTIILAGRGGASGRSSHRTYKEVPFVTDRALGPGSPMLGHALDQARRLSDLDHTIAITVDGRGHASAPGAASFPAGRIIEEPRDCGSAASVFLATTYVLEQDLEATLLFLPSETVAEPGGLLGHYMKLACELAQRNNRLILLGASPAPRRFPRGSISAEDRGPDIARRSTSMKSIRPGLILSGAQALSLHQSGAILNTRILVARAKVLWALGWLRFPHMIRRFDILLSVLQAIRDGRLPPEHHSKALSALYGDVEPSDFHADLLARSLDSLLVLVADGVAGARNEVRGRRLQRAEDRRRPVEALHGRDLVDWRPEVS